MTHCSDCGKPLYEDSIHTCTPKALRLADVLDGSALRVDNEAAAELRRLHAENEALRADAERYRWLKEHPNEWRIYRKHGKHKLPFRMMRDGDPWGQSFATADEAVDAARSKT